MRAYRRLSGFEPAGGAGCSCAGDTQPLVRQHVSRRPVDAAGRYLSRLRRGREFRKNGSLTLQVVVHLQQYPTNVLFVKFVVPDCPGTEGAAPVVPQSSPSPWRAMAPVGASRRARSKSFSRHRRPRAVRVRPGLTNEPDSSHGLPVIVAGPSPGRGDPATLRRPTTCGSPREGRHGSGAQPEPGSRPSNLGGAGGLLKGVLLDSRVSCSTLKASISSPSAYTAATSSGGNVVVMARFLSIGHAETENLTTSPPGSRTGRPTCTTPPCSAAGTTPSCTAVG